MAHMHYTGTGKVHSFRGLLADGGQDKIRIQGPVGAIAWRMTKLAIIPYIPGNVVIQAIVKVYREQQDTVDAYVNFTDNELLGVANYEKQTAAQYASSLNIIFDNTLFVRNIYVTHYDNQTGEKMSYYIELEEVKVGKAGMAQLAVAAARRREER